MRRFYSFMLMATMLFIGANVWAASVDVEDEAALVQAFQNANDGDVINVLYPIQCGTKLVLNKEVTITLDLTEAEYLIMNTGTNPAIEVKRGVLKIQNGEIRNDNAASIDLIRVVGTTATNQYNAAEGNVYSQVIVESSATINNTKVSGSTKFNAMTITEVASATPYSNGARIDVKGTLNATTYGIKVNGTIQKPANLNDAPYVRIYSSAKVYAGNNNKAVAAYCAGYAHWLIEGECKGATGVYVKSGDVDIDGATVSSNFTGTYDPVDNVSSNSGVTGAGSAVAVESNQNYSGSIEVSVTGGATLTAGTGYALEENVSNNAGTVTSSDVKVEAVTVEDATFNKGTSGAGAITISKTTTDIAVAAAQDELVQDVIVVTSAQIDGDISFGNATTGTGEEEHQVTLSDLVTTSAYIPQESPTEPAVVVPLNLTLTSDGFASFSSPINLYKKANSTYKIHTGIYENEVLTLAEVNFIKAGQGVIITGTGSAKCEFTTYTDNSIDNYGTNHLKASADWVANGNHDAIYCLRKPGAETMFYQYTGTEMPANKAYLDLNELPGVGGSAPARIRMVIAETQDVENIEKEAVKAVKFVKDGQIVIRRGDKVFNMQGQIVK